MRAFAGGVQNTLLNLEGVEDVAVELVWGSALAPLYDDGLWSSRHRVG